MGIQVKDSLAFLSEQKDFENDIIFCDPPYALGSEVIIRKDGKVDYKKAVDFMNKWDMPTGDYWEKWFIEAYRVLKYGGYLIMYGMDRQTLLFKYYASLVGFIEHQSLYWYYISNFPKASDLSKGIDKYYGKEREVVAPSPNARPNSLKENNLYEAGTVGKNFNTTLPSSSLAKKYEGYKYSVAPLKQTCETIMVFKKPNKTGSVLHDTLVMENGDNEITCSALNIDANRVPSGDKAIFPVGDYGESNFRNKERFEDKYVDSRYPAQTFIDSDTAKIIDDQSGDDVGQKGRTTGNEPSLYKRGRLYNDYSGYGKASEPRNDKGGASKILHTVDFDPIDFNITPNEFEENAIYEEVELDLFGNVIGDERQVDMRATLFKILAKKDHPFDLFIYQPKVSVGEREIGLTDAQKKERVFNGLSQIPSVDMKDVEKRFTTKPTKNNHPTLKPIELNYRILSLFKTPNEQKICYPFAGSGSEIIGGLKAGFYDWTACELLQEYVNIAHERIAFFMQYFRKDG